MEIDEATTAAEAIVHRILADLGFKQAVHAKRHHASAPPPPQPGRVSDSDTGIEMAGTNAAALAVPWLPDELWADIFAWTGPAAQLGLFKVCRRWMTICRALLVVDIDVREHQRSGLLRGASPETQMSDASLGRLRAKYHGIATAVLSGCRKLTADGLSALLRGQLPATQPISMVGLDLTGCRVTEQWLAMIAASCRKLQRLVLEDCSELTDDWIAPVAKRCGELTDLDLTWCNQLTDAGCDRLAAGCPRLVKLNLTCCSLVGDGGLVSIAAKCAIVELNLHGCRRLTDVALRAFGERLGTLEVLDVGSCNQLSDKGFAALTCGRLKTLTVSACPCLTDAGLKSITHNCRQLKALDLDGCSRITGPGLSEVGARCHRLTSLNLNGTSISTDAHFGTVATGCPALAELNLGYCDALLLGSFRLLATGLQLSSVDLYSCAQVDDAWLEVLATTSPQLKDINLGYCADVTLPGLERFGAGCPQLGSLRLAGCWQVGDDWVERIIASFRRLRRLELAHTRVQRVGLEWLQVHHPEIVL